MSITDTTFVTRSLTGRMFSTVVTSLSVAIAVGLVLTLVGMRRSGEQAFSRGLGNMHLLVSAESSGLSSVLNSVYYAEAPDRALDWETFNRIAATQPWDWFIPTVLGDTYRGLPVMATTPEMFERFEPNAGMPWVIADGRVFGETFEVLVGSEAARAAGLGVGDSISLTHGNPRTDEAAHVHDDFSFRVVGVLGKTGSAHDRAIFTTVDASWILHANDDPDRAGIRDASGLIDSDRKITGVYGRLLTRPGSKLPANYQQVYSQLRADPSVTVTSPRQETEKLFAIVGDIDQIIIGLAIAVLLSSGVGILLSLYNTMDQRRRQIALLRVLGATRSRVFGLVMTESAVIGFIGAIAGVGLSLIGSQIVAGALYERLGLVITPEIELRYVMLVVLGTVALAGLAGLFPAVAAYRTSVVRNLRPLG